MDPIKAMNDASATVKVKANKLKTSLSYLKTYTTEINTHYAAAEMGLKDLEKSLGDFNAAFTLAVEKAGLTASDATEHLHAIAAVIKLAEAKGVKLAPEIEMAPIVEKKMAETAAAEVMGSANPWEAWNTKQSIHEWRTCEQCAIEFDLTTKGWEDDLKHVYCSAKCAAVAHPGSYYPTIPYQQDYNTSVGRGVSAHKHAHDFITMIRDHLGDHIGWFEYVKQQGFYKPNMHAEPKVKACVGCTLRFNLSERGWKIGPGSYACSVVCAEQWGEKTKNDECVQLFIPNILGNGGDTVVGCTCDVTGSWVDAAQETGWSYPEYASKP